MRVFVTGATGFIGSAVIGELLNSGHEVVGLARSDKAAMALTAVGAHVHRGSLENLESLRSGACEADGVIHLAYVHDFTDYVGAGVVDLRAVETIGTALEGSNKPFVVASGTLVLTPGRLGTEEDAPDLGTLAAPRAASERAAVEMARRGVRSSVVRLAPSVHDVEKTGFVGTLIDIARKNRFSAYIDDGKNRWPAVHRLDAAHLFCLALEKASGGTVLHGVAEEGVRFRDIADVIGRHLKLPVISINREEAGAHFGWLGAIVSADNPASSALTQERLEWHPVHPGLISNLEHGSYFDS
ncbi:hopanoid-associated sugar epimerase [Alicyclobacillus hesperidum URH17-3-68]|uniref:SDR family oxidoreductase n=1 Tax=Alicyclobacillus hesperidum TaxID=89784 RepID=UPI000281C3C1|nr:SDR family oxidoreductase [Alicyclobacillus hesperidum]EJY54767.1 hopanoid-associated sugar epimerase [Alicyclobacillus hesperidum URH17-3-68]